MFFVGLGLLENLIYLGLLTVFGLIVFFLECYVRILDFVCCFSVKDSYIIDLPNVIGNIVIFAGDTTVYSNCGNSYS